MSTKEFIASINVMERQVAEIERLRAKNNQLCIWLGDAEMTISKLCATLEEITKLGEDWSVMKYVARAALDAGADDVRGILNEEMK